MGSHLGGEVGEQRGSAWGIRCFGHPVRVVGRWDGRGGRRAVIGIGAIFGAFFPPSLVGSPLHALHRLLSRVGLMRRDTSGRSRSASPASSRRPI